MKIVYVTGWLGSGKTTFLLGYLRAHGGQKTAVIVNEFGNHGVDTALVRAVTDCVREVAGGSIFCACRSDKFIETALAAAAENPDVLLVEASGMAGVHLLQSATEVLAAKLREKGISLGYGPVVCLADAEHVEKLAATVNAVAVQLAMTDLILLNKCDRVSGVDIARIRDFLHRINPCARVYETVNAAVDFSCIDGYTYTPRETLPFVKMDLTVQKCEIRVAPLDSLAPLNALCAKIAAVAHRVKGVVLLGGTPHMYQYACGRGTAEPLPEEGKSNCGFLTVIGSGKASLTEAVQQICDGSAIVTDVQKQTV